MKTLKTETGGEMSIKISVIIPVYNTEKYLEKCLKSVIDQSLKEIEILIINDGSKDNSEKICKRYVEIDSRIKYMEIKNSGVSIARNTGIDLAQGEYISFIDSDDYIENNMLKTMYEFSKKNNLDILGCGINYITEENSIQRSTDLLKLSNETIKFKDFVKEDHIFGYSCNKIFKTKIIKDNNIKFLENCRLFEDSAFVFEVGVLSKKIGYINECFYNYLAHSDQAIKKLLSYDRIEDFLRVSRMIKNRYHNKKNLKETVETFYINRFVKTSLRVLEFNILKDDIRTDIVEQIFKRINMDTKNFNLKNKYKIFFRKTRFYLSKSFPNLMERIRTMKKELCNEPLE